MTGCAEHLEFLRNPSAIEWCCEWSYRSRRLLRGFLADLRAGHFAAVEWKLCRSHFATANQWATCRAAGAMAEVGYLYADGRHLGTLRVLAENAGANFIRPDDLDGVLLLCDDWSGEEAAFWTAGELVRLAYALRELSRGLRRLQHEHLSYHNPRAPGPGIEKCDQRISAVMGARAMEVIARV